MSSSRRAVLDALRAARAPAAPAPDLTGLGSRFLDPGGRFAESLAAVGGALVKASQKTLPAETAALAERVGATRVVSAVEGAPGNVRLEDLSDPHELEGIDLAILPGAFGVAENGAVWLPTAGLRHRGVFVVAEHLALVVPAAEIVHDLHEAYRRLSFPEAGFGTFVAGPSKTADIEQALVIGAHGARSCTVFLVG